MASPRPVLRQQLASLLWSRREREQARGSLRQSVHEVQDTLGPVWSHLFITDRHHLSLRGAGLEIDALSLAQSVAISAEMLDKFEDVLLEDLGGLDPAFDRWLEDERARFQRIGRAIGESLLAQCVDPEAAIEAAEQLLVIDRQHEGAWRTIMRSHAERGDLAAAVVFYERCRGVLAETSNSRPSPETEELIGRIRGRASAARLSDQVNPGHGVAEDQAVYTPARSNPQRDRSALRLHLAPLRTIGAAHDDGLALGLAEEISAGLSRFRWISCVPGRHWPGVPAGGDSLAGAWAGVGGGPGPGWHDPVRARPGKDHHPVDRYAGGWRTRLGGPFRSSDDRSAELAGRVGERDRRPDRSRVDEARGKANGGGPLARRDGAEFVAAGSALGLSAGARELSRCPPSAGGVATG